MSDDLIEINGKRYKSPTTEAEAKVMFNLIVSNQHWRLNNLYKITNTAGKLVPFKMNWAQEHFYSNMHTYNVILKARQLGFSTFIMIFMLDTSLFNSFQNCGVITRTEPDSIDLFDNKIKLAWDNLPEWIKPMFSSNSDTARKITFQNNSKISVGTGYRGGTLQVLHVSEFGSIANNFPKKAEEIESGAFEAVHLDQGSIIFVESTAEGSEGAFCDLVDRATNSPEKPNVMQPKLFFYPWYMNPEYVMPVPEEFEFTTDQINYFNDLPAKITPEQRYWYLLKQTEKKDKMKREYPSTIKEAFEASVKGALWTSENVEKNRRVHAPVMKRIVVSVDPATTNNADSDETGIIVAGVDHNDHGYVLEDASGKYSPSKWAQIAVELYHKWEADRIVAETNQGGDMVELTVRNYDDTVSYKGVRASKGKYARAEPVSALYERDLIHHIGRFNGLESQQVGWSPDSSKGSPDRIDALVWAFTDLMLKRKLKGARMEII